MSWTKRQIINQAFSEIGLANYTFDLAPEQWQDVLIKLDSMLAGWGVQGIRLGYPIENILVSDLDTDSNIADWAIEAVYTNLSARIAPSFGKVISQDTRATARKSFYLLLKQVSKVPQRKIIGLPAGAGNKGVISLTDNIDTVDSELNRELDLF